MIAAKAVAGIVRVKAMILQVETGENFDLEIAAFDPPSRHDRCEQPDTADIGASCKIAIAALGEQQFVSEAGRVAASGRSWKAAEKRSAATPEIEAAEIEKFFRPGAAVQMTLGAWRHSEIVKGGIGKSRFPAA